MGGVMAGWVEVRPMWHETQGLPMPHPTHIYCTPAEHVSQDNGNICPLCACQPTYISHRTYPPPSQHVSPDIPCACRVGRPGTQDIEYMCLQLPIQPHATSPKTMSDYPIPSNTHLPSATLTDGWSVNQMGGLPTSTSGSNSSGHATWFISYCSSLGM